MTYLIRFSILAVVLLAFNYLFSLIFKQPFHWYIGLGVAAGFTLSAYIKDRRK